MKVKTARIKGNAEWLGVFHLQLKATGLDSSMSTTPVQKLEIQSQLNGQFQKMCKTNRGIKLAFVLA